MSDFAGFQQANLGDDAVYNLSWWGVVVAGLFENAIDQRLHVVVALAVVAVGDVSGDLLDLLRREKRRAVEVALLNLLVQ